MSQRKLSVGAMVQARHLAASTLTERTSFRIEQLVQLEGGGLLYKIKSDGEPFDRIVDEHGLIPQATGPTKRCAFPS
jgi:hypothetical protein